MKSSLFAPFLLVLLIAAGCTTPSTNTPANVSSDSAVESVPGVSTDLAAELTREARLFLEAYAQDIRSKNGAAVAGRYHPAGTYFNGGLMDHDSIVSSYSDDWEGPSAFEWRDLDFEILGPESVLATGTGLWGRGDTNETMNVLYAAVLVRQNGQWKIRVEDETVSE